MADYNPAVALNTNPPDPQQGLNTLSKIMTLGQQGLGIRGQQSQNQSLAAKATIDTQTAKENQALAGLMSDPIKNGLVDQDGNPTKDAQTIIMRAAPTTGSAHTSALLDAATKKVGFNSAVNSLRTSERSEIASTVAGAASGAQQPSDVTDAIDNLVASKKGTPEEGNYQTIANTAKAAINHLASKTSGSNPPPAGQEPWRQGALNIGRSVLPPAQTVGAGGIAAPQGATQETPTGIQAGTTAPALQGGAFTPSGPVTPKGIPPGFELTEDPITHNKYLWNRQTGETKPFGAGAPTGSGKTGPASPNAPPSAPPQRQIGEAQAQASQVDTNFQNHQANVKAASAANQQLDQIKNVASILDSGVKTGAGAQAASQAEQALSNIPGLSGLAGANSQAAKFDLLNKFLERIGADYGSLNGSPAKTDAGAESLRSQIGSTGYNPEALRDVMKYTAAQYQAAKSKDTAEQNFFSKPGNGITNQDQFEKQWRNSYDPRVYQLANESKEVSKAALQKMDPADRATFMKKYAELKAMGAAPQ